jgi:hypothetical protein
MIQRLRSRKAEVTLQVDQLRASTRFEAAGPPEAAAAEIEELREPTAGRAAPPRSETGLAPEQEEESYTARLLRAKKKAWKQHDRPKE